jgi:hypothetical protein
MSKLLTAWLLAGLSATAVSAQSHPALTLFGEADVSKTLTQSELAALPQTEVSVREADSSRVVFRGPTLRALMTLVGAPTGQALRGPAMLLVVLAEASDGYQAAYMLAEIDEQFGARTAILALSQDGHALPAKDGPLRIVVAGEEHRARWVRQVIRLRLVRVKN